MSGLDAEGLAEMIAEVVGDHVEKVANRLIARIAVLEKSLGEIEDAVTDPTGADPLAGLAEAIARRRAETAAAEPVEAGA